MLKIDKLTKKLRLIKLNTLKIIFNSKSSHIGSNFSCAHILLYIFDKYINKKSNYLILSKGHASAIYYSILNSYKYLSLEKLFSFSRNNTYLSGHISKSVSKKIIYSSGSLGNGIGVGSGISYHSLLQKDKKKCFVVISDGDLNEGSTWESILFAGHHKLKNLIVVLDSNKIQNIDKVKNVLNLNKLKNKFDEFGWQTLKTDGHDFRKINNCFIKAINSKKPTFIEADTIKGKGVSFMEDKILWHYKNPNLKEFNLAQLELQNER